MNILHLSPFVPDVRANHAGGVCMGKQVETLKKDNHVFVLTFVNNAYEEKLVKDHPDYEYVKTSKWTFIGNALAHILIPNMFAIRSSRTYKKKLLKILRENKIDAIHAEFTAMGQYFWIKKEFPDIQFNITEHDVVAQSYQRQYEEAQGLKKLYCLIERNKVKKKEKEYLDHCDHVFTFNQKDADLLKKLYQLKDVYAINPYYGLDFNETKNVEKRKGSICFVGQMARDENHIAAMRLVRIFQNINDPNYHLTIIGAHPRDELLKCESENIHITGFVEDINEEISKNEIAVFPLTYGAGIKLKVLLAFGLGLPVITSSIGAEGIDEDGTVLELAETDEEYQEKIISLLTNEDALEQKSKESIEYVKDKFNWEVTEDIFKKIYSK